MTGHDFDIPLSSDGSPQEVGSPASTVLSGCCDFQTFIPRRSFPPLRGTTGWRRLFSLSMRPLRPRIEPGAWSSGNSDPDCSRGNVGISQVSEEPRLSVCTCSSDPGRTAALIDNAPLASPPLVPRRRLRRESIFRGSVTWLSDSLPTPHATARAAPR